MAEEFIGTTVLVSLKSPPNAKIQGLVADVVSQTLTLSNVTWLASGHRTASFAVDGHNIVDLEIASQVTLTESTTPSRQSHIDPAILSYQRPLVSEELVPSRISTKVTPPIVHGISPPKPSLIHSPKIWAQPTVSQASVKCLVSSPTKFNSPELVSVPSATLTGPFNDLSLNGGFNGADGVEHSVAEKENGVTNGVPSHEQEDQRIRPPTKGKRRRRKPKERITDKSHDATLDVTSIPKDLSTVLEKEALHSVSEEQRHSLLARSETQVKTSFTKGISVDRLMVPSRRARALKRAAMMNATEAQNGWATEEATDIAEMGDFDFEANLSKFDKRGVFEQMKHDDTTADEARLVSFNRRPARPGTAGGKNLHYSENVLDSPKVNGHVSWNSDPDSGGSEAHTSSERESRRAMSWASSRRHPSRKASSMTSSSKLRPKSPFAPSTHDHDSRISPGLQITTSGAPCYSLSPLQMLELEQLATSELGLTDDMLTENAARGIAETTLKAIKPVKGPISHERPPRVTILAGNTRSGARAIAAARHLRNHQARILVCVLGLEREPDLLEAVRRQLSIYRCCGGKAIAYDRLPKASKGTPPTDFIIDALLGIHASFEDLRTDDQAEYYGMASWVNKSSVGVLAIDMPSGVDASSGTPTTADGVDVTIYADQVLSLGAPKTGLVKALSMAETAEHPKLYLADIGLGNTAWKRFVARGKMNAEFGGEWVVPLRYVEGSG